MKKYILILLILNCGVGTIKNRSIEKDYYNNGKIRYEVQKFNDKLDGYSKYWDEEGRLLNVVNYSNGVLHGEWKEYHLNGSIKYILSYKYGLKNGYEFWYYDNGVKKSETLYEENRIVVDIIRWDRNGDLIYK